MTTTPPKVDEEGFPILTAHFIGGWYDGGERDITLPSVRCQVGSTIYRLIAATGDRRTLYYMDESRIRKAGYDS